ncbi:MAG: phosphoribosylaminoimidazolesuccinocarboxamide synthase, partial [Alphaproteobacteria bacterium]|nr:phosphoribosylaminoimidazolesuccinocarboxamide synthase [Alphaproteobacteria bacterium]
QLLYEGKAKKVFTSNNPDEVVFYFKDDATAFNAQKRGTIVNKGIVNNATSALFFPMLETIGIPTHFIKKISDREQICKKVSIIPLEFIVRNIFAGSTAKKLGIEEGVKPACTIFEICYKKDELGDPLINDYHAVALGLASHEELQLMYQYAAKINDFMVDYWDNKNIILVDFKIEFGKNSSGNIVLADEISPDTCRLWEKGTLNKLDKDRFRRDLGGVEEAYQLILKKMSH